MTQRDIDPATTLLDDLPSRRSEICDVVRQWRLARAARARTEHGGHAWANAEVAVRFWRDEFRQIRAGERGAA